MTSISALHTTIQFPGTAESDLLPDLRSCAPLWPDLDGQIHYWLTTTQGYPVLDPLMDRACSALAGESLFQGYYQHARAFAEASNAFLTAHWINMSIDALTTCVQHWMDVGQMLAEVERDVPALAGVVQPFLLRVGQQQHRLLTMLAVLQAFHFAFCSQCGVSAVLHPASAEEEEEDSEAEDQAQRLPQVTLSPTDQIEVREVFG